MKLLQLALFNLLKLSFADLDIFNKCPDFQAINNFEVETLFGDWFVLEMVIHYDGRHKALHPDVCVTVYLNGTHEDTFIDLSIRNQNKKGEIVEEINYDLRVNGNKRGFWIDYDARIDTGNVQVIMMSGNFTVLTFCEKSFLTSFILSRERNIDADELIISAHSTLERRGLIIESVIALCRSSKLFSRIFFLRLVVVALTLIQLIN